MGKTKYIYKPGTTQFAGSIGEGRESVPSTPNTEPVTTSDPVDAPALGAAANELKKLTPEEKLANAEESLLQAIDSLSSEEGFKAALDFAAKVPGYSIGNTLLLSWEHNTRCLLNPDTPGDPGYFMSYNRWKEHGRTVVKGAKGYPILGPKTIKSRWYEGADGKPVILKKGDTVPPGKEVHYGSRVVGFTVVYTFPQYLTEGEDIPEPPRPKLLEGESLPGLQEEVKNLIEENGYTLSYVNRADDSVLRSGANGYTDFTHRQVVVCADLPSDFARDKTLLHEYAHMVMHDTGGEGQSEHHGLQEVQAEAAAYLTFKTLADFDTSDYSVPYTAGWLTSVSGDRTVQMREAQRAINAVGKVATTVVDAYHAAQVSTEEEPDPSAPAPALVAA